MDIPKCTKNQLYKELLKIAGNEADIQILCIGTDKIIGDSLGPLVGHILAKEHAFPFPVYGTLQNPVAATNLSKVWEKIKNNYTIAIDAAITCYEDRKGFVTIDPEPLQPGEAFKKKLPLVGDISIKGIVMHQYEEIIAINLGAVMTMAEYIASEIIVFAQKHQVMREAATTLHSKMTREFNM